MKRVKLVDEDLSAIFSEIEPTFAANGNNRDDIVESMRKADAERKRGYYGADKRCLIAATAAILSLAIIGTTAFSLLNRPKQL